MKIVHTADWHIGKSLRGKNRYEEQREVLNELERFLIKEEIDILLIGGDIFDSPNPSPESEEIVYKFLRNVSQNNISIIIIAGNHDSGLRFEAISNILSLAGIEIRGFLPKENEKIIVKLKKRDKIVNIVPIPFISESYFIRAENLVKESDKKVKKTYSKKIGEKIKEICSKLPKDEINIMLGHLLISGAKPSGSERRLYIGDNYAVEIKDLPLKYLDYIALGHIHLYQKIESKIPIFYAGSILQLDFGEANTKKGFLYIEIKDKNNIETNFIELKAVKKLVEIEGTLEDIEKLVKTEPNLKESYIKVKVKADASRLGVNYKVKKLLPNVVDINREYTFESPKLVTPLVKSDWLPKLYKEYYQKQYDQKVPDEILEEFKKLYLKFKEENIEK